MPFALLFCWIGYQYRQIVPDYCRISNNLYTLLIHKPGKDANFRNLFVHIKINLFAHIKKEIILLFVQRKHKQYKMVGISDIQKCN